MYHPRVTPFPTLIMLNRSPFLSQKRYYTTFGQRLVHSGQTLMYASVILGGVAVVTTTIYNIWGETKRSNVVNTLYVELLDKLAKDEKVLKALKAPIIGQYEKEWRNRHSKRPVG